MVSAPPQVWIPPSRLDIKINFDTAVGPRYSTIAVVVRDWRGELEFAGCQDSRSKDKEMKKKNKEQNDIPAPA